jgi:hypothetical protein
MPVEIPPPEDPQWKGAADFDKRLREAYPEWWEEAFAATAQRLEDLETAPDVCDTDTKSE